MSSCMPLVWRFAVDLTLYGEELVDASHGLDRNRRILQLGQLEELAPTVRPAGAFDDLAVLAPVEVEPIVATVGVGLHQAAVGRKMTLGMLATAITRVVEEDRWSAVAAEWAIVAHIGPEARRRAFAFRQHRHRCVVGVDALGGQNVFFDLLHDWRQRGRASTDPIGKCRDVEIDALNRVDVALAIEREMRPILVVQHRREQLWAGTAARDRMRRCRCLCKSSRTPGR